MTTATPWSPISASPRSQSCRVTHPGALIGTPAYMSPEQCSGDEVSGASDQYALGAVAYEMITGVTPFSGSTLTVMQAHLEQPPQPVRSRFGECPSELEAAVLRMLEKDPAARWPSIAQAKTAAVATPLAEDDPLLAELCRLATPDPGTSRVAVPSRTTPGHAPSSGRSAAPSGLVRTISILPPPDALETGDSFTLVAMLRGKAPGHLLPGRRSNGPRTCSRFCAPMLGRGGHAVDLGSPG